MPPPTTIVPPRCRRCQTHRPLDETDRAATAWPAPPQPIPAREPDRPPDRPQTCLANHAAANRRPTPAAELSQAAPNRAEPKCPAAADPTGELAAGNRLKSRYGAFVVKGHGLGSVRRHDQGAGAVNSPRCGAATPVVPTPAVRQRARCGAHQPPRVMTVREKRNRRCPAPTVATEHRSREPIYRSSTTASPITAGCRWRSRRAVADPLDR